ncbi:MAG: ABC transporter permease [Anaerolineales bacterium]|nr:ABC transporter permease [Anaerolineales bacterium]
MSEAAAVRREREGRREFVLGVVYVVVGVLVGLALALGTDGLDSTFALASQRGGVAIPAPDMVLPTAWTLRVIGLVIVGAGVWQLIDGRLKVLAARRTGQVRDENARNPLMAVLLGLVATGAIFAFLVWATRGKSMNLTGMLVSSLIRAAPIGLAAISGIYSERSGVVNIGIEGMMLTGAFLAVVGASISGSSLVGLLAGVLAGMLFGLLHAVLAIRYRVNQIISGTMIIILALGLTSYLQRSVLNAFPQLNRPGPAIPAVGVPLLWRIPVLGPVLFNQSPVIYLLLVLAVLTHWLLYRTRWGLRMRAVGEHPRAADTLGINVYRTRYTSVMISGAIAGLAGAYMSIGSAGRFNEGMTVGKGFLGLAAMIFGNWNPGGAFAGALIFGFFDSWQEKLSILQVGVPVDLLGMAPYLATMIVLAGVVGRARPPAASGEPYEKG